MDVKNSENVQKSEKCIFAPFCANASLGSELNMLCTAERKQEDGLKKPSCFRKMTSHR